jgi:signal transduction histidine kinase
LRSSEREPRLPLSGAAAAAPRARLRPFATIRFRFAAWIAILFFGSMAAFGGLVFVSVERHLTASIDDSLRLAASEAIAALNIESGRIVLGDSGLSEITAALSGRGVSLGLFDEATGAYRGFGALAPLESSDAARRLVLPTHGLFRTMPQARGADLRVFAQPVLEQALTIGTLYVARSTATVREALAGLAATMAILAPLMALLSALVGYYLAARALKPIDRITRTARQIGAENLSGRLGLDGPDDEVGRLASTFDAMLDRIESSFEREKRFTSDVSHELRTPLAAMQTIVGYLRDRERPAEERERALADLADEIGRLGALTGTLLALVRGEVRAGADARNVDLSAMLRDLAESAAPLAAEKGLEFSADVAEGLRVIAAEDDLVRLLMNLIDNAVKYTEKGKIEIRARLLHPAAMNGGRSNVGRKSDIVRVEVADTGVGIAEADRGRIFDRFYRADPSRSRQGFGLGLSIAAQIARSSGGSIGVESELGKGSRFTVDLPAAD